REDFAVGQLRAGLNQAALNRLSKHRVTVDTATVIQNFNQDVPTLVRGAKLNPGYPGLSNSRSLLRRFDTMIEGVAKHVHERIGEFLHDVAIQFCIVTVRDE